MRGLFCMGVDSSIAFTKSDYYFQYKNTKYKLTPQYTSNQTDSLVGEFKLKETENAFYSKTCEFLSLLSFATNNVIIPRVGIIVENPHIKLHAFTGGYSTRRRVPTTDQMEEIYYIPPIDTIDQSTLVRLFRQAIAADNIYLEILFYWHILSYPEKDNSLAIKNINENITKINNGDNSRFNTKLDCYKRIQHNPIFNKNDETINSLGEYISKGVRNSIAHIVRFPNAQKNIDLDNLEELRHLSDIAYLLKDFSISKLKDDYSINKPHDLKYFSYYHPTK